jgi:hypothetical protein
LSAPAAAGVNRPAGSGEWRARSAPAGPHALVDFPSLRPPSAQQAAKKYRPRLAAHRVIMAVHVARNPAPHDRLPCNGITDSVAAGAKRVPPGLRSFARDFRANTSQVQCGSDSCRRGVCWN